VDIEVNAFALPLIHKKKDDMEEKRDG